VPGLNTPAGEETTRGGVSVQDTWVQVLMISASWLCCCVPRSSAQRSCLDAPGACAPPARHAQVTNRGGQAGTYTSHPNL
jgi:hypothetical protein